MGGRWGGGGGGWDVTGGRVGGLEEVEVEEEGGEVFEELLVPSFVYL